MTDPWPLLQRRELRLPMSFELSLGDRFPRHANVTTHPLTDEDRAAYKAYKKRFKKARKRWDRVVREGVTKDWASWGSRDEDPRPLPLEPRTDVEWLETRDEYRARLKKLADHYAATGEWLEPSQPTVMGQILADLRDVIDSKNATRDVP